MRKRMKKTIVLSVLFGMILAATGASADAAEPLDGYSLLIQQSPVEAGSVNPGTGVHKVQIGQTVSLTAVPKPGYRFLYWLGDVSATGTADTTIQVDSPKMVVAVFTREAYEEQLPGVQLIQGTQAYGGGGRMVGTPMSSPTAVNPGSYYDPGDLTYSINYPDYPTQPLDPGDDDPLDFDDDIPVPNEFDDDIPVPGEDPTEVPEPATVMLLGLGGLALLKRQ